MPFYLAITFGISHNYVLVKLETFGGKLQVHEKNKLS